MDPVKVVDCNASECAFNHTGMCHALAITVGGGTDHECDTYWPADTKGGLPEVTCKVGACKVPGCKFNKGFMCTAAAVSVGHEGEVVDCLSFVEA